MKNLPFIVAAVLVTIWTIGFFGYDTGMIFHLLLVIAAITVIVKITLENKTD